MNKLDVAAKTKGLSTPCVCKETEIRDVRLATAYVPFQKFCNLLPPFESLAKGTAFPELFSPYSKREYGNLEPEICGMAPLVNGGYK